MIHEGTTPETINSSVAVLLNGVRPVERGSVVNLSQQAGNLIDVRDCAALHVDLLAAEGAANQRFIASARK